MTVTATYDPVLSRVRLTIDGLGLSSTVLVERSSDGIRWSTVRGAAALPVSGGVASVDDYEFTPGVLNTYRATPGEVVETFESATLTLTITGTWARADDWAYEGSWSYKSAAIADSQTSDADIAVPTGATLCEFKWKVSSEPSSDFFRVLLDGIEQGTGAAGEFEGFTSGELDVSAVTTVTARYVKDASGSAGDDAAWIDNVRFWGFPTQQATITPTMTQVWIKNVARPFLNRAVNVTDWDTIERPARGGIFPVVGRSFPVAVTDVRGSRRYELVIYTDTVADADDLELCLAAGDPVLLHVPPDCLVPRSMYAVVGDIEIDRRSVRGQRRYLSLPLTEVAAPAPEIVGATVTWTGILAAYASWSDLLAGEPTWQDVADRIGTAEDVIVP